MATYNIVRRIAYTNRITIKKVVDLAVKELNKNKKNNGQ